MFELILIEFKNIMLTETNCFGDVVFESSDLFILKIEVFNPQFPAFCQWLKVNDFRKINTWSLFNIKMNIIKIKIIRLKRESKNYGS